MSAPGYPVPHHGYPVPQPGYPFPQPGYPSPQPPYPDPNQPAPLPGFHAYPFAPGGDIPPQQPPPHGYLGPGLDPSTSQQAPGTDPRSPIAPYMPLVKGIPPGLEYLTQIDQILIHQKVELIEAFISFETKNKYEIRNSLGQKIYFAKEKSDCCTRNCCGSLRQFDMKILDPSDREVIRFIRPFRCVTCWCPCCLQELEVQSPPGTTIGFVIQNWHAFLPKFSIQNASKETVLKVVGPCLACNCCCGDVNFEVKSRDESQSVGRISKQWSGLLKEVFTDSDNFGIQFPIDLDVKMKAVLLGACFLLDFMFFERVGHDKERNTVLS
uniref:Phospholipid scramblase n=1 Tax=Geotrypetes seraphini TaxID=260995 RepID=A0A6P8NV17_GEOSA|nr:phospholipid scramblase 1-like [Geotrypetes seraphini]